MATFSAWIFRNAIIIKDKLILIVYVGGIVTLQVSLTQWRYIHHFSLFFFSSTSDQDRISPYNINTISSRQVMRIEKNIDHGIIS